MWPRHTSETPESGPTLSAHAAAPQRHSGDVYFRSTKGKFPRGCQRSASVSTGKN